jgi:hypothetical protein
MGIFDSVRNGAVKAKLHAEIALLDRQIVQQQSALGVELYDKLTTQQNNKMLGTGIAIPMPSIFHSNADAIRGPLEDCRRDVVVKQNEKEACKLELEKIGVNRERAPPAVTNQDAVKKAGSWVTDTGKEAQLNVRIKLLEREIHQRKEKFGVQVFDLVVETNAAEKKKGNTLVAGIGKLTGGTSEKDIQDCISSAARQVALTRQQKDAKLREIAAIDEGAR